MQRRAQSTMEQVKPIGSLSMKSFWAMGVAALVALPIPALSAEDLPVLGKIVSGKQSVLSFPRDGILSEVFVDPTDTVKEGEIIALISCGTETAQRDAAIAAAEVKRLSYQSQVRLMEYSSATGLEVELSKAEWQQAQAEVKIYDAQLNECVLVAPFSGVISELFVEGYSYISQGEPVVRLIEPVASFFEFMAPIEWASGNILGQPLIIRVTEFDLTITGRVDRVFPEVEPVSRTQRMRAEIIDAPAHLPVGLPGVVMRFPE